MTTSQAGAQRSHVIAFIALVLGAIGIGFAPICVRMVDIAPVASAAWRLTLAAPILLIMSLASRPSDLFKPDGFGLVLLAGIAFAADLGVWHYSIAFTSVANATLLANLAPVFIALWTLWVLKRRLAMRYWLGLALGIVGAGMLVGANFGQAGALLGDGLGLLTALFYAVYQLAVAGARGSRDTLSLMAISTLVSAIALWPFALASGNWWPHLVSDWQWLVSLALVSHVLGQGLIAYAFAHLAPAVSSVGLLIQPVAAVIFARLVLGETIVPLQSIGAVIVLAGLAMCYRTRRGIE